MNRLWHAMYTFCGIGAILSTLLLSAWLGLALGVLTGYAFARYKDRSQISIEKHSGEGMGTDPMRFG